MKRSILLLAVILFAAILYLWIYPSDNDNNGISIVEGPYLYRNPEIPIDNINLFVFYAVPNNKDGFVYETLAPNLKTVLDEVVDFHENQFRGRSNIQYSLFPEVVALEKDNLSYDTYSTAYGNFEALKNITLEIEDRVFNNAGDLFNEDFVKSNPIDAFRVIAIIYEGVGASGTEGSLILSRDFITRDEYSLLRSSLFYHELGHTIGMPEGYDIYTNQPFTNDIMGAGRREPIKTNYIEASTLKEMGVISR